MSMTAREVRAAFEKKRIHENKLDGLSLVLFWTIPEVVEAQPVWLDKPFTPAEVCMFQVAAFRLAVDSQVMLRMIFDHSDRLQALFGRALSTGSYLEAGNIAYAAQRKIEKMFVGTVMVELDQLSAANRDLSSEKQLEFFRRASVPWTTERFRSGKLTFRMMIERDPGSLLVRWNPSSL